MEAMLALALDLSGWRGPVAFGAVGIFVVALIARIISMIAARRQRVWLSQGYKSREDVRTALREENLDDWLEKMRSTPEEFKVSKPIQQAGLRGGVFDLLDAVSSAIKETSKGVEEIVSLKTDIESSIPSIEEHGPERIYPKGYKPDFRFSWYRAPNGTLVFRTCPKDVKVSADHSVFVNACGIQEVMPFEGLRVAYPEVGEWWVKMRCEAHYIDNEVRHEILKDYSWYRTPNRIAELYCGCLAPINFGKGFPKVAGSEYLGAGGAGGDGGYALAGGAGSPGVSVIEPPKDRCKFCSGGSEVVDRDANGDVQVVPCPRCKGTGREQ